jgi:hypothetical protein
MLETFDLDSEEARNDAFLFHKMCKFHSLGYLGGCAFVDSNAEIEENTEKGILQNHAYGILDAQSVEGNNLVKVR